MGGEFTPARKLVWAYSPSIQQEELNLKITRSKPVGAAPQADPGTVRASWRFRIFLRQGLTKVGQLSAAKGAGWMAWTLATLDKPKSADPGRTHNHLDIDARKTAERAQRFRRRGDPGQP